MSCQFSVQCLWWLQTHSSLHLTLSAPREDYQTGDRALDGESGALCSELSNATNAYRVLGQTLSPSRFSFPTHKTRVLVNLASHGPFRSNILDLKAGSSLQVAIILSASLPNFSNSLFCVTGQEGFIDTHILLPRLPNKAKKVP